MQAGLRVLDDNYINKNDNNNNNLMFLEFLLNVDFVCRLVCAS